MRVTNPDSAVDSVSVEVDPHKVIVIRFKRPPTLPEGEVYAMLSALPHVRNVRQRRLGGYWLDPELDITERQLEDLFGHAYRLAKRIT